MPQPTLTSTIDQLSRMQRGKPADEAWTAQLQELCRTAVIGVPNTMGICACDILDLRRLAKRSGVEKW